jgi:hypothetical protein
MKNNTEWKPVVGYEGLYEVSNKGEIKSVRKQRLMKPILSKRGYLRIELNKSGIGRIYSVHRLVAIAFIDNPLCKKEVNHINGIKHDNNTNNLEWCTRQENARHSWDNKLQVVTDLHRKTASLNLTKINSKQVIDLFTGIFYDSLKIACALTNSKYSANYYNTINKTKKQRFKYI